MQRKHEHAITSKYYLTDEKTNIDVCLASTFPELETLLKQNGAAESILIFLLQTKANRFISFTHFILNARATRLETETKGNTLFDKLHNYKFLFQTLLKSTLFTKTVL